MPTTKQFFARHGLATNSASDFANVTINSNNSLTLGNLVANSTVFTHGSVVVNTTNIAVGSNVSINTTRIFIGNSTVNATINSTAFALNGSVIGSGAGGSNTQVNFNDSGQSNGSSAFTWNKATSNLNITGSINVSGFANVGGLRVTNAFATIANGTSNTGYVYFGNTGTRSLGYNGSVYIFQGAPIYTDDPSLYISNSSSNAAILYLGNTNTRYLQYDGSGYVLNGAQLTINGGTAWHSGNDGSGSGLDADLLDGYSSADFARLASAPTFTGSTITIATGSTGRIQLSAGITSTTGYIAFANTTGSRKAYLGNAAESGQIEFVCNENSATGLAITGNTNVTGTLTSTSTCTASAFNTSSDEKLKKDIEDIKTIDIQKVRLRQFRLKEDENQQLMFGVIAQELEKVDSSFVSLDSNGNKVVNYIGLIMHFMKHVQDQDKYIKELEDRVTNLELA